MALVSSSFAERYAELTSRVPTMTERLLDVQRNELYGRRDVEAQAEAAFQDVLHVAAIFIADKKARQRGSTALMDKQALTLYKQETAVWFPAAPPRTIPFRANRPLRAFPHAAFAELCDEERELRQWLYGVERHLRSHIEDAGSRNFFYLDVIADTVAKEHRGRQRLLKEEDDVFTTLKQRFFRTVPADYFRLVVVARYGSSVPAAIAEDEDTSVEAEEAKARAALAAEELAGRKEAFQYLQTAYDVRLFALNHREVMQRYEMEQAEADELYPLIAGLCRVDFGGTFYHVPAVALHVGASCPCLRALCMAQVHGTVPPVPHTEDATPPAAAAYAAVRTDDAPGTEVEGAEKEEGPQPLCPTSAVTSTADGAPLNVEDTHTAELSPSVEVVPEKAAGEKAVDVDVDEKHEEDAEKIAAAAAAAASSETAATEEQQAEKKKEWEVNRDSTAAAQVTLYAFESSIPNLSATQAAHPQSADAPAKEEDDAASPPANVDVPASAADTPADEAAPPAADAVVTLSHNNSELTCSPHPMPASIFSCEEIFIGDPFAEIPQKERKAKKPKKAKKSSKSKK